MDINISSLSKKIKEIFEKVNTIAKNRGFQKRVSKMSPLLFLKTAMLTLIREKEPSFSKYIKYFEKVSGGKKISKQGFWKKITNNTIIFLKEFSKNLLESTINPIKNIPKLLKAFKQIFLADSTSFKLPDTLSEKYKGSGKNIKSL